MTISSLRRAAHAALSRRMALIGRRGAKQSPALIPAATCCRLEQAAGVFGGGVFKRSRPAFAGNKSALPMFGRMCLRTPSGFAVRAGRNPENNLRRYN